MGDFQNWPLPEEQQVWLSEGQGGGQWMVGCSNSMREEVKGREHSLH